MSAGTGAPKTWGYRLLQIAQGLALLGLLALNLAGAQSYLKSAVQLDELEKSAKEIPADTDLVYQFVALREDLSFDDLGAPGMQALSRAANSTASSPQLLVVMGEELMRSPDQEALAANYFNTALERFYAQGNLPTCPHQGLGTLMYNRGDYEQAIEQWERYLANVKATDVENDTSAKTRWQLIRLLLRLGRTRQALPHLARAAQLSDSNPKHLFAGCIWSSAVLRAQQ